jgi:hypothetical protein
MGREANVVFRNRRFDRTPIPALLAPVEQFLTRAYYAAVKVPRVLAVTRSMLLRRLAGGAR